jgi:hypothetical protein
MNSMIILALFACVTLGNAKNVDVTFSYKSDVQLNCPLSGEVKYYKQKNATDTSPTLITGTIQNNKTIVVLESVKRDDIEAKYYCTNGQERVDFIVNVSPYIAVPTRVSLTITEGGIAEFACVSLYGQERNDTGLIWKWTTNGTEITESDSTKIVSSPLKTTLTIGNLTMQNKGTYECRLSNFHGEHHQTIQLRIKDKYAVLWPFLAICAEVAILCAIILIYEKKCGKKQKEDDSEQAQNL